MNTSNLTKTQRKIYNFIRECIINRNYPPSIREICEAVGLTSTSSVHAQLVTLEKKGFIRKDPTKPRTIELVGEEFPHIERELVNVPVVGRVAAGEPILAEENVTDYFPIPADTLPNAETFMLKVKGDSMVNVGIFSGDHIIVSKQSTAYNGEIVVALVDDSATVKRFFKEKGHYRLQPENDSMDPIIVDHVEILGKVVGLIRFM